MIGNGIAGVTAADQLRRRHPDVEIDLIAEEPHHLYNRMGISRLVYGRSRDAGALPEPGRLVRGAPDHAWLNTRALEHRPRRSAQVDARHGRDAAPTTG